MIPRDDRDAILIRQLFGPGSTAVRAHLSKDLIDRIDAAAVRLLGGERWMETLAEMDDPKAERMSRQLALEIRAIVANHVGTLQARRNELLAERDQVDRDILDLKAERDRLVIDIEREGGTGADDAS